MKKFQFPLDTVLDYRRQVQDSLQVEMGAVTAEVRRQEEVLAAARQRYSEINQEYREKKARGIRIAEVRGYETALEVQEAVIAGETAKLKKLQRLMIILTKMNSDKFLVNHLQIECIELIPETKIVMMNRSYYLVRETAEEIVQKIAEYNAKVQDIARAVRVIGQR